MIKTPVTIKNTLGLHARVANVLAREASEFSSDIELEDPVTSKKFNVKSIMQLLIMAAGQGSELILHVEGVDQIEASKVLKALFNNGFGEPSR